MSRTVEPPTGMKREVGLLFAALEEARRRTRDVVTGLATDTLDARLAEWHVSIGVLLLHIAGVELWWVRRVVLGEELPASVEREFAAARLDSEEARTLAGHELSWYLGKLDEVRAQTESACWTLKDDDLEVARHDPASGAEYTTRWILSHLSDHEAQHRGQISLTKRLLAARTPRTP